MTDTIKQHLADAGLRVKPLEWCKSPEFYNVQEARCLTGVYRISIATDGGYNAAKGYNSPLCDQDGRSNFLTIQDAVARAQTDYETRILAALEVMECLELQ